jgi:hypothetical protein
MELACSHGVDQDRGRERASGQGGTHAEIGREVEKVNHRCLSRQFRGAQARSGVEFKPVRQA